MSRNLTVDFTANTDFAQVEADELQVNLTRFSLFFPEKREFFLRTAARSISAAAAAIPPSSSTAGGLVSTACRIPARSRFAPAGG